MPLTPEQQRESRMRKRTCGNCEQAADVMRPWNGQRIAICHPCAAALDAVQRQGPERDESRAVSDSRRWYRRLISR